VNAFKEVLDKYNIKPVSFYFNLPEEGHEDEIYSTLDKELEFVAKLGVDKICLQATRGRPEKMDEELQKNLLKKLAFDSWDDLYAAIGYGGMTATRAVNRMNDELQRHQKSAEKKTTTRKTKKTEAGK
jgi:(p)ppGpp synthase/HD superfamily hydrolase